MLHLLHPCLEGSPMAALQLRMLLVALTSLYQARSHRCKILTSLIEAEHLRGLGLLVLA